MTDHEAVSPTHLEIVRLQEFNQQVVQLIAEGGVRAPDPFDPLYRHGAASALYEPIPWQQAAAQTPDPFHFFPQLRRKLPFTLDSASARAVIHALHSHLRPNNISLHIVPQAEMQHGGLGEHTAGRQIFFIQVSDLHAYVQEYRENQKSEISISEEALEDPMEAILIAGHELGHEVEARIPADLTRFDIEKHQLVASTEHMSSLYGIKTAQTLAQKYGSIPDLVTLAARQALLYEQVTFPEK